jgi:hypothetical protein
MKHSNIRTDMTVRNTPVSGRVDWKIVGSNARACRSIDSEYEPYPRTSYSRPEQYNRNGRPLARTASTRTCTRPVRVLVSHWVLTGRFAFLVSPPREKALPFPNRSQLSAVFVLPADVCSFSSASASGNKTLSSIQSVSKAATGSPGFLGRT